MAEGTPSGEGPPPADQVWQQLEEVFRSNNLHYRAFREGGIVTNFYGIPMEFQYQEPARTLLLVCPRIAMAPAEGPTAVPPDRLLQLCRLLLDATFRLARGAFSRDERDGEVRFEVQIPLFCDLSTAVVRQAVEAAVLAVQRESPRILALVHGGGEAAKGEQAAHEDEVRL